MSGRIGRTGRIGRVGRTGRTVTRWAAGKSPFLAPKGRLLETWRLHFGTLGDQFGDPGVYRDTPQDTFGSRPRFLSIFGGFLDPPGTHLGTSWVTFSRSETAKVEIGL